MALMTIAETVAHHARGIVPTMDLSRCPRDVDELGARQSAAVM